MRVRWVPPEPTAPAKGRKRRGKWKKVDIFSKEFRVGGSFLMKA